MGLDITLNIVRIYHKSDLENKTWWLLFDRISFDRDYDLFGLIGDCGGYSNQKPVLKLNKIPNKVKVTQYKDEGCKDSKENPYGEELVWCWSNEFKNISLKKITNDYNKSLIKFIASLKNQIIVIEWR